MFVLALNFAPSQMKLVLLFPQKNFDVKQKHTRDTRFETMLVSGVL